MKRLVKDLGLYSQGWEGSMLIWTQSEYIYRILLGKGFDTNLFPGMFLDKQP